MHKAAGAGMHAIKHYKHGSSASRQTHYHANENTKGSLHEGYEGTHLAEQTSNALPGDCAAHHLQSGDILRPIPCLGWHIQWI